MLFSTFLWHKYTAAWPVSYKATIFDIVKAIVHISSSGVLRGNISWAQNKLKRQSVKHLSMEVETVVVVHRNFWNAAFILQKTNVSVALYVSSITLIAGWCNDAEVLILRKSFVFHIHLKALHMLRLLTLHGILTLIFNLTLMTVPCCFAISHTF